MVCADAAGRVRRSGFRGIHESPLLTTVLIKSARRSLNVPQSPRPVVASLETVEDSCGNKTSCNEIEANRPLVRRLRSILHHSEVSDSIGNSKTESEQSSERKKRLTRYVNS